MATTSDAYHGKGIFAKLRGVAFGAVFAALFAILFHLASLWSPRILRLEHQLGDWRTGLLSDRLPRQHGRLAVVVVDENTFRDEPYRSAIDRRVLARLVRKLDDAGAKTIALDFLFFWPTELAKDEELIATLHAARTNIVLAAADERAHGLGEEERSYQEQFLERAGREAGYANLDEDRDEVVRRRLGPNSGGRFSKSFATLIAESDGAVDSDPAGRIAWLRKAENGADAFFSVNATDVVEESAIGARVRDVVKERLVLVGGGFPDRDRHRTPLFDSDGEAGDGRLHGVFLHAHIVAQLLDARAIRELPEWPVVTMLSFLGFSVGWSLRQFGVSWLLGGVWTVLLIGIDLLVYWRLRLIIPYVPATAGWVVGGFSGYWLGKLLVR
jgi:CHASE2 domain-containing sensor protein